MKRMSMILMACLMVLGMSQCKKENQNASTEPEGVKITLTVDNGGERVAVTPGETVSTVTFEDGDVILVADDQHYLGSLSRTNGVFTGTVTQPGTDHLHFFFAGNKVAPNSLNPGTSTGCKVDMSDQSTGPAVISYVSMDYNNESSVTANVKLLNKASGLVKFTTNIGTTNDITIAGVYNKMNITFGAEPTIATDQTERGTIKLNRYTGDNDNKTFLAVIPEQSGVNGASVTVTGFTADNIDIPPVTENMNGAMSITLTAAPSVPAGAINGKFSVSYYNKVYFSKGNLQYRASTNTWRFAENQWDFVGTQNPPSGQPTGGTVSGSDNFYISQTYNGWIDLFGWGTSGINDYTPIATCWQPWSTSTTDSEYNPYGSTSTSLNSESGKADWGYNAISNGGNQAGNVVGRIAWRTLTSAEWGYLFNSRKTGKTVNGTSNARYTKATINTDGSSVNGIILFPDGYSGPSSSTDDITFGNINSYSAWSTQCTSAGWQTLDAAGCVFLPTAGNRIGTSGTSVSDVGSRGRYWSSTYTNPSAAKYLHFYTGGVSPQIDYSRSYGISVRLVCPAE